MKKSLILLILLLFVGCSDEYVEGKTTEEIKKKSKKDTDAEDIGTLRATMVRIDSMALVDDGDDYRKDYPTWFSMKLQCKPKIAIIIEVNKNKVELDLYKHFDKLEVHYITQCMKQFRGWHLKREKLMDADEFNIIDFTFDNQCKPYPTGWFSKIRYESQEYKNWKESK